MRFSNKFLLSLPATLVPIMLAFHYSWWTGVCSLSGIIIVLIALKLDEWGGEVMGILAIILAISAGGTLYSAATTQSLTPVMEMGGGYLLGVTSSIFTALAWKRFRL